jgi:hypothetical protein
MQTENDTPKPDPVAKQETGEGCPEASCSASFESLETAIACHSRDWSTHRRDAWIYGIVCGWSPEAMRELEEQHGWGEEESARLQSLRDAYVRATHSFLPNIIKSPTSGE